MLSKVLKGAGAGQVPLMVFAAAAQAENELQQPLTSAHPIGGEDQSILLDKIRTLEAGMAAATRDAFEAGNQQGEQQARASLAPVVNRMNAAIADLVNMRPEMRRRAEKDAVDLALLIARRVLHRELNIDTNALNALARVVFDRMTRAEGWKLSVHPQYADAIRAALPAGSGNRLQIETDPAFAPGTLIVRCEDGTIDASVDSQLEEISRGLADKLTPAK